MTDHGLTGKKRLQQASEALIYASLIEHGLGHLTTFSDGAQQFNVFRRALAGIGRPKPSAAQQLEKASSMLSCGSSKVIV